MYINEDHLQTYTFSNWTPETFQVTVGCMAAYGDWIQGATFDDALVTATMPGDANGDGKTDINDLTVVLANYNQTGMGLENGDMNGDSKVDINDLTVVLTNYNKSLGASAVGVAAVPEPASLTLAILGLVALSAFARKKRS
jgi:hypothetical protein